MKTRHYLIVSSLCFGIVAGTLAAMTVMVSIDNRDLRGEILALRGALEETASKLKTAAAESETATASLAAKNDQVEQLEEELARVKVADSKPDTATATPGSIRVRAYLGQQYLGMGWMILNKMSKDAETGRAIYEPVVVLDESVKANAALYKTNFVEREVSRSTTVNYNYPQVYPYYPVIFFDRTHHRPGGGTNMVPRMPAPNQPPPPGNPFRNDKFFLPKAKPFLPPVDQNRVAPRSAQSGVNAGNRQVQIQAAGSVASRRTDQVWTPTR